MIRLIPLFALMLAPMAQAEPPKRVAPEKPVHTEPNPEDLRMPTAEEKQLKGFEDAVAACEAKGDIDKHNTKANCPDRIRIDVTKHGKFFLSVQVSGKSPAH